MEEQVTILLTTLNEAISKGLDKLPWAAEQAIQAIGAYQWAQVYAAAGIAVVGLVGIVLSVVAISLHIKTYGEDISEGKFAAVAIMADLSLSVVALVGGVVIAMVELPDAISPLGWILSRNL